MAVASAGPICWRKTLHLCKSFAPCFRQCQHITQFLTNRMVFLIPNQWCQGTEGSHYTHAFILYFYMMYSLRTWISNSKYILFQEFRKQHRLSRHRTCWIMLRTFLGCHSWRPLHHQSWVTRVQSRVPTPACLSYSFNSTSSYTWCASVNGCLTCQQGSYVVCQIEKCNFFFIMASINVSMYESDDAPLNVGLATAYHRAQNWQAWISLVETATSIGQAIWWW